MDTWQKAKSDEALRRQLLLREHVIDGMRIFFKTHGFLEIETPLFVRFPDPEPSIEPFATSLDLPNTKIAGYLTTSPEFSMKKILASGVGSIFQICKAFRNGEQPSTRHNSEFTILEWYRINADYTHIMQDCEDLLLFLLRYSSARATNTAAPFQTTDLTQDSTLTYQGKTYDFSPGWERLSVLQAFEQYAGIDESTFFDRTLFGAAAQKKGYSVEKSTTLLELQTQLLVTEIEPHLGHNKPTFLYDYPADQAALSRKKASDPRFAERFELYIAGLELANAFSELVDPAEQESRLRSQQEERIATGRASWEPDGALIEALHEGIPPTGGIAMGVDRIIMLFADTADVSSTLFFPQKEWF